MPRTVKKAAPKKTPAKRARKRLPVLTLAEWTRRALDDIAAIRRRRATYRIDMSYWHEPNPHVTAAGKSHAACVVCFAGAVLAAETDMSTGCDVTPGNLCNMYPNAPSLPREQVSGLENLMHVLNSLRTGNIRAAVSWAAQCSLVGYKSRLRCQKLQARDGTLGFHALTPVLVPSWCGDHDDDCTYAQWRNGMRRVVARLEELRI
jgi:hypothetical protein